MCGIVGYIGKQNAAQVIVDGLTALEYRGYDSAGIALIDASSPNLIKQVGRVEGLVQKVHDTKVSAPLGIGHTRWATHGAPTLHNAHPHTNADQTIFVVHNGIIENYAALKARLETQGYRFTSQTDTEVIPHLIDYYRRSTDSFAAAFSAALGDLTGAYAIAAVSTEEPQTLFAARLSSPLVIGVGEGEYILASDPTALLEHTKKVIFLDDYDVAVLTPTKLTMHNLKKDAPVKPKTELLDYDNEHAQLGDFEHFMLKEIYEAPATVQNATVGRVQAAQSILKLGGLDTVTQQLKFIDRIVIVACGTSYYAGLVGEYLLEELAGIPVEVQLASEFKYRQEPFSRSTALLAISQSGETADTIAALKKVEDYGVLRLGVVNAVGSTIARMTDAGVYCHAGPEQAVASTKAFIAQVTVLTLIALHLSSTANTLYKPLLTELAALPDKIQAVLDQSKTIASIAKTYAEQRDFLFIGRGYGYPCAFEGALKLKEVSYIHAEGYAAGEMKHGPLAMIDASFPTVAIATDSPHLDKTYSNIEEIRARGGPVIALATQGNKTIRSLADDVIYLPKTLEHTQPILVAVALQLFAYYVATARGLNVDRPRNLAKSVTVE
ncbi:MAG TPA: glutamine--fructose-6-phosphate transaminase (isomerizing) [Candidatus Saccharimonadales bacterium]|nr:glutamine--fructose-6-phosphate transaminase (isomerizing) [Candidatus Saccharimonadales bacterium]